MRRVPPRFSIPPTDNEIMPGGSVNITCVAVGSPMPYVKWMLGAEDLTPEDDMPIGRNVLELTDVRQSANYTCVAMSTLGVIEAVAQITVKGMRDREMVALVQSSCAAQGRRPWPTHFFLLLILAFVENNKLTMLAERLFSAKAFPSMTLNIRDTSIEP